MSLLENLSKNAEIQLSITPKADGQATNNGAEIDMAGFDSVCFVLIAGAITGAGTITMKIQQDTVTGMGTAADLAGTSMVLTAAAQSDLLLISEIIRPQERFVRPVVTRAVANSILGGVVALKWKAKNVPVTQGATVGATETHLSPAEGAA